MSVIGERLLSVVQELTGMDAAELDASTPLVQLGLDSLVLTQLAQRLRREFATEFSFRDFFTDFDTLDAIEGHIASEHPEMTSQPSATGPETAAFARLPSLDVSSMPMDGRTDDALADVLRWQLQILWRQLEILTEGGDVASAAAQVTPAPAAPAAEPAAKPAPPKATVSPAAKKRRTPVSADAGPSGLTPHQEQQIRAMVRSWNQKTPKQKALVDRQRPFHADPRTAAGFDLRWKEICYPVVAERSAGPYIWDIDGNRYIDLVNGFGPTFFGHSPDFINEAIARQLEKGFEIGPQTPLAGEAAALICELTGLDRACFACTGSEAVQAAIRVARTYTGRDQFVVFSDDYHGNFDPVLVNGRWINDQPRTLPAAPGIPQRAVDDVTVLDYGTDRALQIIRQRAKDLAAVIVEPVQSRRPELQPREFLLELRRITREAGALLVFDEVVTGFRCHPGGAQAVFGIEADLCTFGKVLGGGMPIGVVAGRRPFMDALDGGPWQYGDDSEPTAGRTFFAGTFVRHPLVVAAAHAVLTRFKREGPALQEGVSRRTDELTSRLNAVARNLGLPIEVPNFTSVMYFRTLDAHGGMSSLFYHMMKEEGVLLREGFPAYLTTTHEPEHIDAVVQAFERSAHRMQEGGFWPSAAAASKPVVDAHPDVFGGPPVPNARLGRAPDGSPAWYVEDPATPGAYVRVE